MVATHHMATRVTTTPLPGPSTAAMASDTARVERVSTPIGSTCSTAALISSVDHRHQRDAAKGGARHIALRLVQFLREIDRRLPAAIGAIDGADRHRRGDPAEDGRRRRSAATAPDLPCARNSTATITSRPSAFSALPIFWDMPPTLAPMKLSMPQASTSSTAISPGRQARQQTQPLHLFAERHRDEAGGENQLQPVGPADKETGERPDGPHRQGIRPAGLGNGGAQFHGGHGVHRQEQPAGQPGQDDPCGIEETGRHHRRIAQDARTDHAAQHHRQAEAQAEDAQQPAAHVMRLRRRIGNGHDDTPGAAQD